MIVAVARNFCLVCLLLVTKALPVHAQDGPTASEAQIKAAYLYKFPGFVDWPSGSFSSDASAIVIGVTGADAIYQELTRQVAGRLVQGRPVDVRRVSSPLSGPAVQVLYIGSDAHRETAALLAQTAGRPVLTVTDNRAAPTAGAVLNLVEVDGRIRFEASLAAAAANGLKLSSRLLSVAARVTERVP